MQNQYSLLYREDEREMYPTLKVRLQFRLFRAAAHWFSYFVGRCLELDLSLGPPWHAVCFLGRYPNRRPAPALKAIGAHVVF